MSDFPCIGDRSYRESIETRKYLLMPFLSSTHLRSLLLTGSVSFAVPILLIGLVALVSLLLEQIPFLQQIGDFSASNVLQFLQVFGNGSALEGILVIGVASSIVGALFDLFASNRTATPH